MIDSQQQVKFYFFCFLLLLIFERLQNTFHKSSKKNKPVGKGRVFQKGFFYILLSVYLFIVLIDVLTFLKTDKHSPQLFFSGLFIYFLGVTVRRVAIRTLGDMWSVFVEVKSDQRLVKEGVYEYIKHPYYLAVMLELSGFSLLCQSLVGLLLAVFLQGGLLFYRIKIENRILDVFSRRQGF